ncbi:hypothetical protein E4U57_007081 [Claviceps arundinis]|uniref:Uncharacterized protein n=1 Tax=Claviceps arundinis TaxID=1623583 RepID=A0ABQ7P198_9HYPO|nr:hypothetical protein E4U57_007081 [Claviceps arundinis]
MALGRYRVVIIIIGVSPPVSSSASLLQCHALETFHPESAEDDRPLQTMASTPLSPAEPTWP